MHTPKHPTERDEPSPKDTADASAGWREEYAHQGVAVELGRAGFNTDPRDGSRKAQKPLKDQRPEKTPGGFRLRSTLCLLRSRTATKEFPSRTDRFGAGERAAPPSRGRVDTSQCRTHTTTRRTEVEQ